MLKNNRKNNNDERKKRINNSYINEKRILAGKEKNIENQKTEELEEILTDDSNVKNDIEKENTVENKSNDNKELSKTETKNKDKKK